GGANIALSHQKVAQVSLPQWAPGLGDVFSAVTSLLMEAAESLRLAAAADGPLRTALVNKAKRERRLADAVFDRARAILRAPLTDTSIPDVDIRPPVALPDLE